MNTHTELIRAVAGQQAHLPGICEGPSRNIQTSHAPVFPCAATYTYIMHKQKLHFIAYKSISLFAIRNV